MHCWSRVDDGAICTFCNLHLTGEDGEDVFHGAETPIGQIYGKMPS